MRVAVVLAIAGCADAPPAQHATKRHSRELVYMSRNSWDAVPEDIAVYADGRVEAVRGE
jgi:hypothetical protein